MKKLGLYLLSYKRPSLFKEALDSLLAQDDDDFEIIVSENSPDESITPVLQAYRSHPQIKVIRRSPSLGSLEHFNQIIQESSAYEFAMFFHDDDILLPQTVRRFVTRLQQSPEATAISGNAVFLRETTETSTLMMRSTKSEAIIRTPTHLMYRYFTLRGNHAPFPGYMYRTKFLENLSLSKKDGGKYSDVSFLLKLITRGPFIWLPDTIMKYRIHATNDSAQLNLKDMAKLSWFSFKMQPLMLPILTLSYAKQVLKKIKMQFD